MAATVNQIITGEYDHTGIASIYCDTDSVAADSMIDTNYGRVSIEHLFIAASEKWTVGDKEYAYDANIKIPSYDPFDHTIKMKTPKYIYRHKTSKARWKIVDSNGNSVIVTEDHSVMVKRNAEIVEIKPNELQVGDILVTYHITN